MTAAELILEIEALKHLMIAVATGGPRIAGKAMEYVERRERIGAELRRLGLEDPNAHDDLWAWYGRWSRGDLPSYQSRREYVADLYADVVARLRGGPAGPPPSAPAPTGWARVDRALEGARDRLSSAQTEEDYQTVGLLCREALISLAQAVYDRARHPPMDGVEPSATDAKRMLDAYLAVQLESASHEAARRYAKAALTLANEVQHRRTADFRDAALCLEATASVVNAVAIVGGRRDSGAYAPVGAPSTESGTPLSSAFDAQPEALRTIDRIIERAQHPETPLALCVAEALTLAREIGAADLARFCEQELAGSNVSDEAGLRALGYRGMDAWCSPGQINTRHPAFAGNAEAMFAYIEAHPGQFTLKTFILQEPVAALERRLTEPTPGQHIRTTLPLRQLVPDAEPGDQPVYCYSRADAYHEVVARIRTEIVRRLLATRRGLDGGATGPA